MQKMHGYLISNRGSEFVVGCLWGQLRSGLGGVRMNERHCVT